jgi:hypothetical protein
MSLRQFRTSQLLLILTAFTACYGQSASEEMLFENAIDDLTGVLAAEAVAFDAEVTNDGTGSLRIVTDGATTVRLYEVGDIDVEDARLVYRAQLRTDSMEGQVYLEMWCRFPGMGEYFSRALDTPLPAGDTVLLGSRTESRSRCAQRRNRRTRYSLGRRRGLGENAALKATRKGIP